jgi:hypothetical protein
MNGGDKLLQQLVGDFPKCQLVENDVRRIYS